MSGRPFDVPATRPVSVPGGRSGAGRGNHTRAGGQGLTEPLTAARQGLDNARQPMHDGYSPVGPDVEPPAGQRKQNLDNHRASRKILNSPLDRFDVPCDDYIKTEGDEDLPIIPLRPASRPGFRVSRPGQGRTANGQQWPVTSDRRRPARAAARPAPLVTSSRQRPVRAPMTRPPVTRVLWACGWGGVCGAAWGALWCKVQGVNLWPMYLWTWAIGASVGGIIYIMEMTVSALVHYLRARKSARRLLHRTIGDQVGHGIVRDVLINGQTFRCETCGQQYGVSELEQVGAYPCGRRTPAVQCMTCRASHRAMCPDCGATSVKMT